MEQPLYQFFCWVAGKSGLLWLVESYEEPILLFLAVLALFSCLFGFYFYRGMVAGLTFLCVTAASFLWIEPAWGEHIAVTVCAVIGVSASFIAFRLSKLGAVALCSAIGGSFVWQFAGSLGFSALVFVLLIFLGAFLAGLAAFLFPLWSVYLFTALWGGVVFAAEGGRLWGAVPGQTSLMAPVAGIILAVGGFILQFQLFRKQKVLAKIMPRKLEYRLEKRREKKGVAV